MKKENRNDFLLRLWKVRQEAEGIDVSSVNTLEEAEHFFDKKEEEPKVKTKKELLEEAASLGLELSNRLKNSEIEEAINNKREELKALEEAEGNEDTPEDSQDADMQDNGDLDADNEENESNEEGSEDTPKTDDEVIEPINEIPEEGTEGTTENINESNEE